MQRANQVTFGQFRLDFTNECLWHGPQAIPLRPKAFAVLKLLVEHQGQLVTKQELLETVWPATFVDDAVLKASIRQLREALSDDAASPRYIETAHRRGYRFIGHQVDGAPAANSKAHLTAEAPAASQPSAVDVIAASAAPDVLGRNVEWAMLRESLQRALTGERQIVFVTGEAGIGKTTLVNDFLRQASAGSGLWIARGQCVEQYGAGESYLPVLEGLSRLGRGPDGDRVVDHLRQHAPAWLLELPTLLARGEIDTLRQQVAGPRRERMLREMTDALEALSAEKPVILVLEDLHWSDYSTVDLVAYLARRRDPARLMVIGSYRPVDLLLGDHRLNAVKRELQAHALAREIPLSDLSEEAVSQFLAARFPGRELPKRLSQLIYRRSEGNPLFMVNLVEYLLDERAITKHDGDWRFREGVNEIDAGIPESIRQLIEKQIERLSPEERRVLESASVVGMECSSLAIAAGLDEPVNRVEEHCETLVKRHQFLTPGRLVELPDGTMTSRYTFSHVLYLEVPYRLTPPLRRAQIHRRIGQRGEAVYRGRLGEIAGELAMHFEQGADYPRAATYLLQAAATATHRGAHHEAEALARRGLLVLPKLPQTPDRNAQEVSLRLILGSALISTKGFAPAELKETLEVALELSRADADIAQAFRAQWMLALVHYFRAEHQSAVEAGRQLVAIAGTLSDAMLLFEALRGCGSGLLEQGEFEEGLDLLQRASLEPSRPRHTNESFLGQDAVVMRDCYAARALWCLGYPDAALERVERAVSLVDAVSHPERHLAVSHFAAQVYQLCGDVATTGMRAELIVTRAEEYGLPLWTAFGHIDRGLVRIARQELDAGIEELRRGLAMYEATGARLWRPYYAALLAHALAHAGRADDARGELDAALATAESTGEYWCVAELHRLDGELVIVQANGTERSASAAKLKAAVAARAEDCFERSLTVAREQRARSWELRASMSLGRLYERQARRAEARRILSATLDLFTEGHNTQDLRDARALLSAWHSNSQLRH